MQVTQTEGCMHARHVSWGYDLSLVMIKSSVAEKKLSCGPVIFLLKNDMHIKLLKDTIPMSFSKQHLFLYYLFVEINKLYYTLRNFAGNKWFSSWINRKENELL